MSTLETVTYTCTRCKKACSPSEFGALSYPYCKACSRESVERSKQAFIAKYGEDAWRREKTANTRAYRARNKGVVTSERLSKDAYRAALYAIRDAHREHFEALLRQERYERGLDA